MKLKHKIELMEIDDNPIAVPVASVDDFCGIIHINDTTARILRILENDVTEDEIVAIMKREYDATEEQIRLNVHNVIQTLVEHQLIIV